VPPDLADQILDQSGAEDLAALRWIKVGSGSMRLTALATAETTPGIARDLSLEHSLAGSRARSGTQYCSGSDERGRRVAA